MTAEYKLVKVSDQGVQFGNAWYSHESITGYSAYQLSQGACCVTGGAYMKWLSAAPTQPQPIFDEAAERKLFEAFQIDEGGNIDFHDGYYENVFVQSAWDGWKQCAQSRAKSVEVGHG